MKPAARCPYCDKPSEAGAGNRWRPFCSERCKMADLGQWFAERYAIPERDGDTDDPAPPDAARRQ